MEGRPKGDGNVELLCDKCGTEIFADVNMVMLHDETWLAVNGGEMDGELCDKCIEEKLGRPIVPDDFKHADNRSGTPLCNLLWQEFRRLSRIHKR